MSDRTVILKGPFTDSELAEICALARRIEHRRSGETFSMHVNLYDGEVPELKEFADRINPLRPGYERVTITRERDSSS